MRRMRSRHVSAKLWSNGLYKSHWQLLCVKNRSFKQSYGLSRFALLLWVTPDVVSGYYARYDTRLRANTGQIRWYQPQSVHHCSSVDIAKRDTVALTVLALLVRATPTSPPLDRQAVALSPVVTTEIPQALPTGNSSGVYLVLSRVTNVTCE